MREYVKQRILNIKSNLSYKQKEHHISNLYDIMEKRNYETNAIGKLVAESIVMRMRELELILSINEKEFLSRREDE